MTKMSIGMMIACTTSILAAIVQWRIYKTSACGYDASTCDTTTNVSLWWQLPIYAWPAIVRLPSRCEAESLLTIRASCSSTPCRMSSPTPVPPHA